MSAGPILVGAVGGAQGSRGAAAALACAGAERGWPGLLIELGGRPLRPGLFSTVEARRLEERLAAHLPSLPVASRGRICALTLPPGEEQAQQLSAALAVGRDGLAVVHAAPGDFRPALERFAGRLESVLLRADLLRDRALTGLAAADLIGRGLRVAVLKRPPGRLAARCALAGALPPAAPGGLPPCLLARLIEGGASRPIGGQAGAPAISS